MLYLAVDQSSKQNSLAVMQDGEMLVERVWFDDFKSNQTLARQIADLQAGGISLESVDCFVLGRGPGAYSGLRSAVALLTACAMPSRQKIYAVSSAEVQAWILAAGYPEHSIMIVGDARRNHYWYRIFRLGGSQTLIKETAWCLCAPQSLPWRPGLVAATAEWDRIGATLRAYAPLEADVVAKPVYPSAAALARLADARLKENVFSESVSPVYLHAPVKKT